jgi:hypothetical protein
MPFRIVRKEAVSSQQQAFSPRYSFVLFVPASFPARLQKAKEALSRQQLAFSPRYCLVLF